MSTDPAATPLKGVSPGPCVLYAPGSNVRAVAKARTLACDAVILDLEDAVAPEAKADARRQVVAALAEGGFGRRRVVVRVNGLDTEWGEADLAALVEVAPDAVLIPKVETAGDVARYDQRLSGAPAPVELWAMIETCRAVLHLDAIAALAGATRLSALVMGTNDLAEEMGAAPGVERAPLAPALALAVTAARAHGLFVFDGVSNDLDDAGGLEAQCAQARGFGFDGKTLIHPIQIEACRRAFAPSPEDLDWARAVAEAFADPANAGRGALKVRGRMVEGMHRLHAERLLSRGGGSAR